MADGTQTEMTANEGFDFGTIESILQAGLASGGSPAAMAAAAMQQGCCTIS